MKGSGCIFIKSPAVWAHGCQVFQSLLRRNSFKGTVVQLDDNAGIRNHFESVLPDFLVRVADELAMATGQLPLVSRQEGIVKADARFGPIDVGFDRVSDSFPEGLVPFRYGKPGRGPGGPFPGLG